jgi:hypothetical protein
VVVDTHIDPRADHVVRGTPIGDALNRQVAAVVRGVATGI